MDLGAVLKCYTWSNDAASTGGIPSFQVQVTCVGNRSSMSMARKKDVNVKQSQLANFIQELVYNQLKVIK